MEYILGCLYSSNSFKSNVKLTFGKYDSYLHYYDYFYHGIILKIKKLAEEAGVDEHGRYYNFEKMLEFAINKQVTHLRADSIYQLYTYHIIEQGDQQFAQLHESEFVIIDSEN